MRVVDVMYAVPFLFVVIFVVMIISEETTAAELARYGIDRTVVFYFLIGAIYWLTMARVVRGQVLTLKNEQFVQAARSIGAGDFRIIFQHLIPNLFGIAVVYLTLTIPSVMLFEAFLSFLGVGIRPPDVSWGLLMQDAVGGITKVQILWWLALFPGLAMSLTLFALNFLGDGLRDVLDPRLKNRE
jgi:oligopeptide transport system permease protein